VSRTIKTSISAITTAPRISPFSFAAEFRSTRPTCRTARSAFFTINSCKLPVARQRALDLERPAEFPVQPDSRFQWPIHGTPAASGTYNFSVHADDGSGHTANQGLALNITGGSLQITTTSLPDGTKWRVLQPGNSSDRRTDTVRLDHPELFGPAAAEFVIVIRRILSARLVTNGTFYFDVLVTDASSATFDQTLSLTVVNPPLPPLIVTMFPCPRATSARPTARNWGYWGRTALHLVGGPGVASPPPGLTLQSSGLISGTPTASGTFGFKAQVRDVNSPHEQVVAITITPSRPKSPAWLANGRFPTKYQRRRRPKLHGPIFLLVDELDDALRHQTRRRLIYDHGFQRHDRRPVLSSAHRTVSEGWNHRPSKKPSANRNCPGRLGVGLGEDGLMGDCHGGGRRLTVPGASMHWTVIV